MIGNVGTLVALALIGPPAQLGRWYNPAPWVNPIPSPPRFEPVLPDLVVRSLGRQRQILANFERGLEQQEQWRRDGDPRYDPGAIERVRHEIPRVRWRIGELERGRLPLSDGPR